MQKEKELKIRKRKTMSGTLLTILLLTIFNTLFNIVVLYYLINVNCERCKEKIEWKRFFQLKTLCETCGEKRFREL